MRNVSSDHRASPVTRSVSKVPARAALSAMVRCSSLRRSRSSIRCRSVMS